MKQDKNVFCSILTKYRLYQFIALFRSMQSTMGKFKFFVLCMDTETYEILNGINPGNMVLIKLNSLENERLLDAKANRGMNEYCWTLKPVLLRYVLDNNEDIERVTYMDADLYFFNTPEIIFNEHEQCSILLSKHDFFDVYKHVEIECGIYNSGFMSFKSDENSRKCLDWWKEKCIEWCFDRLEDGKFGDQKYLEQMGTLFEGVSDIKTPGTNVAPWNQEKYRIEKVDGEVRINGSKLIFYHFCGFRIINANEYALTVGFSNTLLPGIHDVYLQEIKKVMADMSEAYPDFEGYFFEGGRIGQAVFHKFDE